MEFQNSPTDFSGSASNLTFNNPAPATDYSGAIAGASALVGGIASAGSAYAQYKALQTQAAYQRQVTEFNSKLSDLQYQNILEEGDLQANNQRKKVRQIIGSQRAAYASQGIDVGSGSALDVQNETADMGELDVLTIKNNALRAAWGEKVSAFGASAQGKYASIASENAANSTLLTGGQSFLNAGIKAGVYFSK